MRFIRLPVVMALGALACGTENATTVVVDNDYPSVADGGDPNKEMTVFKVWWTTSLLADAVTSGNEGQSQRTVPGSDFAYVVLAPGWDPSWSTPPKQFIVAKSANKLSVARGDVLHVHVSDATFRGSCAGGMTLSQDEADFIIRSIFPGEFAGVAYGAKTCSTTTIPLDGGADAVTDDSAVTDAMIGDRDSGAVSH